MVIGLLLVLVVTGAFLARRLRGTSAAAMGPAEAQHGFSDVEGLVASGKLDAAAAELEVLHRRGESASLERLTAEVAEKRGHRLEALAHLHRAKTLAPTDASIRHALAALLLRFGQRLDACHQAERAVLLAEARSDSTTLAAARGILRTASCAPTSAASR